MTDWLDELCEEYEGHWRRSPLDASSRMYHFLATRGLSLFQLAQAIQAVAEIDIERDWIWWRKWLLRDGLHCSPTKLLAEFTRNATLEGCSKLASSLGLGYLDLKKVYEAEFRARRSWGDNPHESQYPSIVGLAPEVAIARHHAEIRSESYSNTTPTQKLALHGRTQFGRQRSNENSLQRIVFGAKMNRITIADRQDARYSRNQFSLQILSPEFAIVANDSQTHPVVLSDSDALGYLESMILRFPFQIQVVDLVIECS